MRQSNLYTREKHEALVAAFREQPGNITHAAKAANISRETARKAWDTGWKNKEWAFKPIRVVLEEEIEEARAARYRAEREKEQAEIERQMQARLDAIQARGEEARGAKVSRQNAILLAVVANRCLSAANLVAVALEKQVQASQASGGTPLSLKEMRAVIDTASRTTQRAEQVMRMALAIERIVAGEPIAIIGVKAEAMNPEQMVNTLLGMSKTMERAERLRSKTLQGLQLAPSDDDPPTAH